MLSIGHQSDVHSLLTCILAKISIWNQYIDPQYLPMELGLGYQHLNTRPDDKPAVDEAALLVLTRCRPMDKHQSSAIP